MLEGLRQRPAVRFALLLTAGILLAEAFHIPPSIVSLCFLIPTTITFSCIAAAKLYRVQSVGMHVSFLMLGFATASLETVSSLEHRLMPEGAEEGVELTGVVEADPLVQGKTVRLVLTTESVVLHGQAAHLSRRLLVSVASRDINLDSLRLGSFVLASGYLRPFPRPRNPGDFDRGRYLDLNGIQGLVEIREAGRLQVLGTRQLALSHTMFPDLRRTIARLLSALHSGEQAAFLRGLLVADRADLSPEVKQSFIETGTIHILAVSGLHVAMVAVILYAVVGFLRLPSRASALVTILGLIGYMFLTGATPSVVRSTVMACIFLIARCLERRIDMYQCLAVSALLMLLVDPRQLFDVGFQLSFAAVLSIVYFYPLLGALIRNIPQAFEEIKALEHVWKLFAVSLAAQLGTLPFTAYYFGRISIVSLLANMIVVPVSSLNVMVGFAEVMIAPLSLWAAHIYAAFNDVLVRFLLGFVKAAAGVPFASIETSGTGLLFPVCYYGAILGVFHLRSRRVVKMLGGLALLVATIRLFDGGWSSGPSLRITAIDVGQGDAILLTLPNQRHVLLDAGPRDPTYDAGERIILPYLKHEGITSLDAIVCSHPHSDHLGGVLSLMNHLKVLRFFEAPGRPGSRLHETVRRAAVERGIPRIFLDAGMTVPLDSLVRLYVLHPAGLRDTSDNLNNASVVLKIVFGSTSAILLGDVELEAEEKILRRYGKFLDADVVKIAHHGSSTSSHSEFLDGITPEFALLSVGERNKFRHPSPEVMTRLKERGVEVLRTDREGAVMMESNGRSWKRIPWR